MKAKEQPKQPKQPKQPEAKQKPNGSQKKGKEAKPLRKEGNVNQRKPIWIDKSESEKDVVQLKDNKKLRKLRNAEDEDSVNVKQYEQRLRNQ
jgi:hypothetical protein